MTSMLLSVALAAVAAPAPEESDIKLPQGMQPMQVLARVDKNGRIEITEMLAVYKQEKRVRTVIEAWADRTAKLSALPGVRQVFPFENRGREIGVTLTHPHGQIYAYAFVPPRSAQLMRQAAAHRAEQLPDRVEQVLGHAGAFKHQAHEGEERDGEQRVVAHHAVHAVGQRLQEVGRECAELVGVLSLYRADGRPPFHGERPPMLIADVKSVCVRAEDGLWRYQSHILRPIFVGRDIPLSISIDTEILAEIERTRNARR